MTDEHRLESRVRFGVNLRELRKERGLSQDRLGKKSDLSNSTIVKLEAGVTTPSFDTIIAVAGALDVLPSALFQGIELSAADLTEIGWSSLTASDLPLLAPEHGEPTEYRAVG